MLSHRDGKFRGTTLIPKSPCHSMLGLWALFLRNVQGTSYLNLGRPISDMQLRWEIRLLPFLRGLTADGLLSLWAVQFSTCAACMAWAGWITAIHGWSYWQGGARHLHCFCLVSILTWVFKNCKGFLIFSTLFINDSRKIFSHYLCQLAIIVLQNSSISFSLPATSAWYSMEQRPKLPLALISRCP